VPIRLGALKFEGRVAARLADAPRAGLVRLVVVVSDMDEARWIAAGLHRVEATVPALVGMGSGGVTGSLRETRSAFAPVAIGEAAPELVWLVGVFGP
jgi:hypothetical protein